MKKNKIEITLHGISIMIIMAALFCYRNVQPGGQVKVESLPESHDVLLEDGNPVTVDTHSDDLAALFELKIAKAQALDDEGDRLRAYLRLADEAYRTSTDAASAVIKMIAGETNSPFAKEGKAGLMFLTGLLDLSNTKQESQRLGALCHKDALNELDDPSTKIGTALLGLALMDPKAAAEFLIANPAACVNAKSAISSMGYEVDDQRCASRFFETLLASGSFPRELLMDPALLSSPHFLSTECRQQIAKTMVKETELKNLGDSIRTFYSESDEAMKSLMEKEATPQVKEILEAEKLLGQGNIPTNGDISKLALSRLREQPLKEAQKAALLSAAIKSGTIKTDDLKPGNPFFPGIEGRHPGELIRALSGYENTKSLTGLVYSNWAFNDPIGLSSQLALGQLPEQDAGIEALVKSQADDPLSQIAWARKIANVTDRQRVLSPLLLKQRGNYPDLVKSISDAEGYPAAP